MSSIPTDCSSFLDTTKSYNSILNELHDCILTKPLMDLAIQPYPNTLPKPIPIAKPLSMPIAPSLLERPQAPALFPLLPQSSLIAPGLSDFNTTVESRDKVVDELFVPTHKDTLFWCYYIIKYGMQAYFTLGNQSFIVEQQEKISAIELLREKKVLLKQHKISPFTKIEEDLAHNPQISLKTFFALLIANDLSTTYLHKDTFVHVNMDKPVVPHMVQYVRQNVYGYLQEPNQTMRASRIANKYPWCSIDKPVLAMASYKSEELLELFNKLRMKSSIPNEKKPTKKEIYDAILAYFL